MKLKFMGVFLGIIMSLFLCSKCNACYNGVEPPPVVTYAYILDNMDKMITEVFDIEGYLITEDNMKIAKAHWATKVFDMMAKRNLGIHWFDDMRADLSIIRQIFEESFFAAFEEHPELHEYFETIAIKHEMKVGLGLV